jgi:hypothetical protein
MNMNRRLVALVVVVAIAFQGPSLAYASAAAAKTMPASCAGHQLCDPCGNNSCCPEGMLPGACYAGGTVFTGMPSAMILPSGASANLLPFTSDSVAFATERPSPLLRPPIA